MKRLIRWALNHIPRPVLQRMASWAVPVMGLFYRGRGVECPLCGSKYRKFLPYGYVRSRANALCPKCLSLERHRLLWLYLTRETDLLTAFPRTLHIAPEVCIMRHLKPHFKSRPGQYLTADLESPLADLHFDVQQIPLEDNSVDVVLCNHILEHVADDRKALRELHREVCAKFSYIQQARRVRILEDLSVRQLKGERIGYRQMLRAALDLLNELKFEIVNFFPELVDDIVENVEKILSDRYLCRTYIDVPEEALTKAGLEIRKNYGRLVALQDGFKAVRKARAKEKENA